MRPDPGPNFWPSPLWAQALARPRHIALRDGAVTWTYADWAAAVANYTRELVKARIEVGERVAVIGTAGASMAVCLLSLRQVGAVPVPLAPAVHGLTERLLVTGSVRICLLPGPDVQALAAVLARARPKLPRLDSPTLHARQGARSREPLAARVMEQAPPAPWPLDAPWFVLTTSGSTGAPKAIGLSGLQIVASAFGVAGRLGSLPQDVWLGCLPWHHVGGLMVLLRALLLGTSVVVQAPFAAEAAAELLDGGDITLAPLVPTMLAKILAVRPPRPFPGRLRALVLGGAAVPAALLTTARTLCLPVCTSWGMTESASQVATQFAFEGGVPNDAGPPLSVASVRTAQGGRLVVSGPVVAATLVTADVGAIAADGHVHIAGRADDVLIVGGENLPVAPIEAVLGLHPALADVAVSGRPDPVWGERPVAHLVAREPAMGHEGRPDDDELLAFCRERLASLQCPVAFIWHEQLPRDALGKLRRRLLPTTGEEN